MPIIKEILSESSSIEVKLFVSYFTLMNHEVCDTDVDMHYHPECS